MAGSDADLDALEALLQAATPGPWDARPEQDEYGLTGAWLVNGDSVSIRVRAPNGEAAENMAALIAAAVTALPDLLRRVRLGDAAREVCDLTADLRSLWKAMGAGIDGAAEAYSQRLKAINAARARYRALLEQTDAD